MREFALLGNLVLSLKMACVFIVNIFVFVFSWKYRTYM